LAFVTPYLWALWGALGIDLGTIEPDEPFPASNNTGITTAPIKAASTRRSNLPL